MIFGICRRCRISIAYIQIYFPVLSIICYNQIKSLSAAQTGGFERNTVMDDLHDKEERLKEILRRCGSLAAAFSGGVDSTYLCAAASEVLGSSMIAVTVRAPWISEREYRESADFCRHYGIRQETVAVTADDIDGFRANPPDRCYICKKALFGRILRIAERNGMACVADGSNADDPGDYRPGMRALKELGIFSPLLEAGLTKQDIRELSRERGLPTWDKPSNACLATRFVYGETITDEKLQMVDQAEQVLLECGFRQMRVRVHGDLARIEVPSGDIRRFAEEELRRRVLNRLKEIGFPYITLDLQGFRSGSMNEAAVIQEKSAAGM